MKRLLTITVALLIATFAVALPAAASPPQDVSGAFTVVSVIPTSIREAGNNCIIEADVTFAFTGGIDGAFSSLPLRIVHHGPCDPLGPAPENFQGDGTFAGTVNGVAGSFDFNFRGKVDAAGNAEAKLTVRQGSGGLEELHGAITLTGITGVGGTYEGRVHFD
jgi:hypothetical protein